MLPEIFRQHDPVLELSLPPETRQELERLLESLPETVFTAPDSLGWTYQFWQAERKDEVNSSGKKIGADELPAVTQLFTERYMVLFLLHNTIGAWRAGKILADHPEMVASAIDEEELRRLVRLETGGGYYFSYLRFARGVRDGDEDGARTGPWRPAAGTFSDWPVDASEFRVLDPCCGSGHFLVEAFELLVRLRMSEKDISVEETILLVLRDNLFGLEIDARCTQIAAFNLALAAWKLAGAPIGLPPLNIACTGLVPVGSKDAWVQGTERVEESSGLAVERDLFGGGSVSSTRPAVRRHGRAVRAVQARSGIGIAPGPGILGRHSLQCRLQVVAKTTRERGRWREAACGPRREDHSGGGDGPGGRNPTGALYAGRDQRAVPGAGEAGTGVCAPSPKTHHSDAKGDIATVFVSRIFGWLGRGGTQAVVSPQNWLFLTTYRRLRERLLQGRTWNLVARLGEHAFEDTQAAGGFAALNIISEGVDLDWEMVGVDVSAPRGQRPIKTAEKAKLLQGEARVVMSRQEEQLKNPDAAVLMRPIGDRALLGEILRGHQGIATADYARYGSVFWGFPKVVAGWVFQQSTVKDTVWFGGRQHVLRFEEIIRLADKHNEPWYKRNRGGKAPNNVRLQGLGAWGRQGIAVSQIGQLPVTRYTGEKFDNNTAVLGPVSEDILSAVWCFCSSPEYAAVVREIDHALKVTNATLVKIPFDLDRWMKVAAERYPHGLPEPCSDDPTQWIFHGDPCGSVIWTKKRSERLPVPSA